MGACIDLVAAEAVYHDHCLSRFLLYKKFSAIKIPKISGMHSDKENTKRFELLCDWLDSAAGAEMCTLKDLHNKMAEISGRDSTFFAEVGGCAIVVCFRIMAKHV